MRLELEEAVTILAKEFHIGMSTVREMKKHSKKVKKCFAEFDVRKGTKF